MGSIEDRIIDLRAQERRGPAFISADLGVPARTVSPVPARRGQPRLAELDPMTGVVIRSSKQTADRYERSRPGELVHMDVKKLGRIPEGGGWRALGRAGREATYDRTRKLGYDYVHSRVDGYSRLAYSEILPDEKARSNSSTTPWPPNGPTGRPSPATPNRPPPSPPRARARQHSPPPQRTRRTAAGLPLGIDLMASTTSPAGGFHAIACVEVGRVIGGSVPPVGTSPVGAG